MKKILMRTMLVSLFILGISSTALAIPITGSIALVVQGNKQQS